jgi:hypothetical protein
MITNRLNQRLAALICIVASAALMTGCTTTDLSTAFTAFTDIVSGASITSTVLCGAGTIPAPICTMMMPVLSNAAAVAPQIQAELDSSDPLAVQVTKCVALLSPFIGQSIPGLTAEAQAIISGVGEAAAAFVSVLQNLLPSAKAADALARATSTTAHVHLTWKDRRVLSDGVAKSKAAKVRIDSYLAAH